MDPVYAPQSIAEVDLTVADGTEARQDDELRIQYLNSENAALKERLTKLSEATLRINDDLDITGVLHEVIDSACSLTGAKYGVLLSYDDTGEVESVIASGLTEEEIQQVGRQPVGQGLLGYLNEVREPVRIPDIASHPRFVEFPDNHPPVKTFLGMQIRNRDETLGNIYLTEKHGEREFTSEDEETLVTLSSQAKQALTNTRRNQEVQRTRADLETLFDLSPIGIMSFELKEGRILYYNQEIVRIFGDRDKVETPWEEVLPLASFRRFDGREIPAAELPATRIYQFGETLRAEEVVIGTPDGRSLPVLVNGAPIYSEDGEITGALFALQDMTSLADAERVRSEFLGLVSEELRMPLTTIKGSVAALFDIHGGSGHPESQQLLRMIDQQADLMRRQVNSIVELTHIATGTLLISQETTDVRDLVNDTVSDFLSGHPGSEIECDFQEGLPNVMADRLRLGQALNNILFTVTRYTSDLSSLKVSASLLDIYVAISVSAGSTISDSLRDSQSLLQRTMESDGGEIKKVSVGDNLALATSRGVVEAHGGRLRVEDDDQLGTISITFTIPAAEDAEEEVDIPVPHSQPKGSGISEGASVRIMLAINDTRALSTTRQMVSEAGYTTVSATGLDDAGRRFGSDPPDLLLLDISSFRGDEFRTMQRLTDDYGVPIVVLSGQGGEDNIGRAFDMGADDYIVKPFSPTELIARIKSTLRRQATHFAPTGLVDGYVVADVSVNYDARTLTVAGLQVPLTATEYKLLHELSRNAGRILTQDELLRRVWGPEYIGEPSLLRSYVKSLRQKLGDNARSPSYIFTEHGIGYRMARP